MSDSDTSKPRKFQKLFHPRWWIWGGCGLLAGVIAGAAAMHSVDAGKGSNIWYKRPHASLEAANEKTWEELRNRKPIEPTHMYCLARQGWKQQPHSDEDRDGFQRITLCDFQGVTQALGWLKNDDHDAERRLADGSDHLVLVALWHDANPPKYYDRFENVRVVRWSDDPDFIKEP